MDLIERDLVARLGYLEPPDVQVVRPDDPGIVELVMPAELDARLALVPGSSR